MAGMLVGMLSLLSKDNNSVFVLWAEAGLKLLWAYTWSFFVQCCFSMLLPPVVPLVSLLGTVVGSGAWALHTSVLA